MENEEQKKRNGEEEIWPNDTRGSLTSPQFKDQSNNLKLNDTKIINSVLDEE